MAIQTALDSISNSSGSPFGFKNRIINGAMVIDQRNAGAALTMGTTAAGTYGVDRWAGYAGASSLWQMQRVSTGNLDFPFAMRMQRIAAQTSTAPIYYAQVIETSNTYGLAGQSVTLSFYITAGANYSGGASFGFQVITGTAADQGLNLMNSGTWTGAAYPGSTLTPTTTRTLITFTTTLGASVQEIGVRFYWNGTGTAGANDFVDITGVQLEKGSTASSFDYRDYGRELALCQRYFQIYVGAGSQDTVAMGNAENTTRGYFLLSLPVSMRTAPACTLTATNFSMRGTTSFVTCTSGSMGGTGGLSNSFIAGEFNCGSAHGAPAGGCVKLIATTTASTIQISSEL
jgi:hypothetical protein